MTLLGDRSDFPSNDLGDLLANLEDLRPSWMAYGACRGKDTAIFFPTRGEDAARAKAICAECPVQRECLAHAVDTPDLQGVWGGTGERARRRLRVQRRWAS